MLSLPSIPRGYPHYTHKITVFPPFLACRPALHGHQTPRGPWTLEMQISSKAFSMLVVYLPKTLLLAVGEGENIHPSMTATHASIEAWYTTIAQADSRPSDDPVDAVSCVQRILFSSTYPPTMPTRHKDLLICTLSTQNNKIWCHKCLGYEKQETRKLACGYIELHRRGSTTPVLYQHRPHPTFRVQPTLLELYGLGS